MEMNITAAFKNSGDLQQAEEALLRQGVIEIRHLPPQRIHRPGPVSASEAKSDSWQAEWGEELVYPLNVYVEKSRSRQAEDTIRKFGGDLSTWP